MKTLAAALWVLSAIFAFPGILLLLGLLLLLLMGDAVGTDIAIVGTVSAICLGIAIPLWFLGRKKWKQAASRQNISHQQRQQEAYNQQQIDRIQEAQQQIKGLQKQQQSENLELKQQIEELELEKQKIRQENQELKQAHMSYIEEQYRQKQIKKQEQQRKIEEQRRISEQERLVLSKARHYDTMDGIEFEHFCAGLLRRNGFVNVEVSKSSGDHGVDILAEKDGVTYAIQCKRSSGSVGNKAIQEIYSGRSFHKRHIGVVLTNQHFTTGAKEAAARTGILLWDRETLEGMIEVTRLVEVAQ